MGLPDARSLLAPLPPWFDQVQRPLPWRAQDLEAPHPDPYAVLVSEIMLQQTQVATVIPYFQRWMARFPTLGALAAADEEEIHRLWAGLGYYRRARMLQGAALRLAASGWPGDLAGLQALPGLGPYTAAAVGAQAFQWPTPALDGNAFRVLARLLLLDGDPKGHAASLRAWLAPALEAHGPSRLTQAIFELGATLCTPRPHCPDCPLQNACRAHREGLAERIPPPAVRAKPKASEFHLAALSSPAGWLLRPPAARGLLAGLWSWPSTPCLPEPPEGPGGAPGPRLRPMGRLWPGWVQVYTHRRETVHPFSAELPPDTPAPAGLRWVPAADLPELPMGSRDHRLRALAVGPGPASPLPPEVEAALQAILRAPAPALPDPAPPRRKGGRPSRKQADKPQAG